MTKAIITKEFLKTRRAFWCSLILALFFTIYALLGINRVIATHGVEHVWLIMLMKDQTFIDAIKYVPLLCGLLVGLSQMVPEMQQNRLKLTLHLPCPSFRLLVTMLTTGFVELTVVFLIQLATILVFYDRVIAPEMTWHVLLTSLPWYPAGYTAYFFSAAVCLEGKWKRRILLALTGAGVVSLYYLQPAPAAYNGFLPVALLATILLATLSYASIDRFKQGLID